MWWIIPAAITAAVAIWYLRLYRQMGSGPYDAVASLYVGVLAVGGVAFVWVIYFILRWLL